MLAFVIVVTSLAIGAFCGLRLSANGITAANALLGRQLLAYAILIAVTVGAFLLYFAPSLPWMPTLAALYGERITIHGGRAVAAFGLALLLTMEWHGRRDGRRRLQLVVGA